MQNEFQQLMDDLWDGRLDAAGQRRMDELCAADPALARRLRQERNLNTLLSRCGPNHAPADLARSVMARLDAPAPLTYHAPWFAWIFRPAFGAALAFTAMAVIGIQVGLKLHGWRNGGGAGDIAPTRVSVNLRTAPADREVAVVRPGDATRTSRPATRPAPVIQPRKNSSGGTIITPPASRRGGNPTNSRSSASGQAAPAAPVPPANFQEFPTPGSQSAQLEEFPTAPETSGGTRALPDRQIAALPRIITPPAQATPAVPAPQVDPRIPASAIPPTPKTSPRTGPNASELTDRRVAMQIYLAPTPAPSGAPSDPERTEQPVPFARTFAPATAGAQAEPLSVKNIEIDLYAAGGENVQTVPVPGRRNAWEVKASLTPEQFRSFTHQLRTTGILPGRTVQDDQADNPVDRSHAPSSTTHRWEITRGRQWIQPLERMGTDSSRGGTSAPKGSDRLNISIMVEQIPPPLSR